MDEFSLINKIKQRNYKQSSLLKGIGDDAAVFRETANDTVVAVDTFVEGVHFTNETMNPFHIGYRALGANLSDLAAMGASPTYYLVSIVVPKTWKKAAISDLFAGMNELASKYSIDLIGGDTVSGDNLILSVTIIGKLEKDKARYRHAAEVDDIVFVTGTLGDARAGLYLLQNDLKNKNRDYFIKRHRMPTPRIEFARGLSRLNRIALNDVSDGVANEAHEIAVASQVSIILIDELVPVHPSYKEFPFEFQSKWKYFGGEDFELLGTVPKVDWPFVQNVAKELNLKITAVGSVIEKDEENVYLKQNETYEPLNKAGYTHLK